MTFHRAPLPEYEVQDLAGWSYTMTEQDCLDRGHKGYIDGNNVFRGEHYTLQLDTPLCQGCDAPIRDMRCDTCGVIFVLDAKHIGGGVYRVEA